MKAEHLNLLARVAGYEHGDIRNWHPNINEAQAVHTAKALAKEWDVTFDLRFKRSPDNGWQWVASFDDDWRASSQSAAGAICSAMLAFLYEREAVPA